MKVGDIVKPRFGNSVPEVRKTKTESTFRINQDMFLAQVDREQEFKVTGVHQVGHPDPTKSPFDVININGESWNWCAEEVVDPNAPAPQPAGNPPTSAERLKKLSEIGAAEKVYTARDEVVKDLAQLIDDALMEMGDRHGGANLLELHAAVELVNQKHRSAQADGQVETIRIPLGVLEVKVRRGA